MSALCVENCSLWILRSPATRWKVISYEPLTRRHTASECMLSVLLGGANPHSRGSLYGLKLPVLGFKRKTFE